MKIRSKNGEIIDLAILRANLDGGVPWASTILDALEGAFRIEPLKGITASSYGEPMECTAYNDAISDVRIAIGYVEENPA